MQVTFNTKNHTYYCGYITKYEKTDIEKEERLFFIKQKSIGVLAILLAALSLFIVKTVPETGIFTIIMTILGMILILSKDQVIHL